MYQAKLFGKTVRLTNEDLENLKEMWNPESIQYDNDVRRGETPCSRLDHDCHICPFKVFDTDDNIHTYGCFNLLHKILGQAFETIDFSKDRIRFMKQKRSAKANCEKVMAVLNRFKKVQRKK